jgi:hypothetical protein
LPSSPCSVSRPVPAEAGDPVVAEAAEHRGVVVRKQDVETLVAEDQRAAEDIPGPASVL